jgi:DhnA family fructose-bisphosphate aldolase class Ia
VSGQFDPTQLLPDSLYQRITDVRVNDPDCALRTAQSRVRPSQLTKEGHLSILAADHPGRRATRVGDNPLRMADRRDLLARIIRILAAEAADGLLATMDVIEELLILEHELKQAGGPSLLDGRVLIASLNRAGLDGVSWELDDCWSGPTAAACQAWNLDGGKALMRVCDDNCGSLRTMNMCAQAIRDLEQVGLPMFLEPLPVVQRDGKYAIDRCAEALAPLVGAAAALGNSSRLLWLKLPACPNFEVVAKATTLPMVILGGEVVGDRLGFFRQVHTALAAGPNVRGAMIGRNVLYPADGDPLEPAYAIRSLVHDQADLETALACMEKAAVVPQDVLTRWLGKVNHE